MALIQRKDEGRDLTLWKARLQEAMDLSYDRLRDEYDDDDDDDEDDDDDDDASNVNKLSLNAMHITGLLQFYHLNLFLR